MTSSKIESSQWKQLQADPIMLLKYQNQCTTDQQQNINQLNILNNLNIAAQQDKQLSFHDALILNQQQQKQQQLDLMASLMVRKNVNSTSRPRDIGMIEKIMASYGFVRALYTDLRLFFHYSSYIGENVGELKVGDLIEYEAGVDKVTNKPVALNLVKYDPQQQQQQQQHQPLSNLNDNYFHLSANHHVQHRQYNSMEQLSGFVIGNIVTVPIVQQDLNKISYEQADGLIKYRENGKIFCVGYSLSDFMSRNERINVDDQVKFQIAQNMQNGTVRARNIELQRRMVRQYYYGIIKTIKDTFGRIERDDSDKEILFHFTEYKGTNIKDIQVGSNVQFEIQDKYGKEIAFNLSLLPHGSVCFDDISTITYIGRILKTLNTNPNGVGKLIFDLNDVTKLVEWNFREADINGKYTLIEGDIVQFKIATDKRTKAMRATDINLIESSLQKESREYGCIHEQSSEYFGIKCADREDYVHFHSNEVLPFGYFKQSLSLGDCIEFTVCEDFIPDTGYYGLKAIRVRLLPPNSVKFEIVSNEVFTGFVEREPIETKSKSSSSSSRINSTRKSESTLDDCQSNKQNGVPIHSADANEKNEPGLIRFELNGQLEDIQYSSQNSKQAFYFADKVEFNICTDKRSKKQYAINIKLIEQNIEYGYITMLKENYGFLELTSQQTDVFFHYSSTKTPSNQLNVGDEVKFNLRKNSNKMSAENLTKLSSGTIQMPVLTSNAYKGRIIQLLRCFNHDQDEYYGKVQDWHNNNDVYQYGIDGLADKKVHLQVGDLVTFQIATLANGSKKAYHIIKKEKEVKKAKIESIKGQHGFIDYAINDSKKLFFYINDVDASCITDIKAGDEVEFLISQNQRNGKFSAVKIKKVNNSSSQSSVSVPKRPEHLITKLKVSNIDDKNGKELILIRQPRNPDGKMKSFTTQRIERLPGQLVDTLVE